jgi:hypothetical protein
MPTMLGMKSHASMSRYETTTACRTPRASVEIRTVSATATAAVENVPR